MNNTWLIGSLICILFSCAEKKDHDALVQVYDYVLTKDELSDQIDNTLTPEDSTILAENLIENWVKQKMLVAQAERNLPDSLKEFTKKLEEEKNNLLIYTYEKEYISQKMDTSISESELLEFYQEHSSSFMLSDYILQYSVIQSPSENEEISKWQVRDLMKNLPKEKEEALQYCTEVGAVLKSDTNWIYFKEFLNQVPLEVYNTQSFLKKQKFAEIESDNFRYFVFIHDYKLKDSQAPLSLMRDNIKNLILNHRKQKTLKELRKNLYSKAVKENHIRYFK